VLFCVALMLFLAFWMLWSSTPRRFHSLSPPFSDVSFLAPNNYFFQQLCNFFVFQDRCFFLLLCFVVVTNALISWQQFLKFQQLCYFWISTTSFGLK
jgi:hypothetical protein